jgi:hypothetical protein
MNTAPCDDCGQPVEVPDDWPVDYAYCGCYDRAEPAPARAFCNSYTAHEAHVYVALNSEMYACPGLTAGDLADHLAYDPGTCEHGLSADLCSGPNHYGADR